MVDGVAHLQRAWARHLGTVRPPIGQPCNAVQQAVAIRDKVEPGDAAEPAV